MIQVAKCWGGELECAEADVVQGLIVKHHALISILHKLMHRQGRIVWLHHSVRHLQDAQRLVSTALNTFALGLIKAMYISVKNAVKCSSRIQLSCKLSSPYCNVVNNNVVDM